MTYYPSLKYSISVVHNTDLQRLTEGRTECDVLVLLYRISQSTVPMWSDQNENK